MSQQQAKQQNNASPAPTLATQLLAAKPMEPKASDIKAEPAKTEIVAKAVEQATKAIEEGSKATVLAVGDETLFEDNEDLIPAPEDPKPVVKTAAEAKRALTPAVITKASAEKGFQIPTGGRQNVRVGIADKMYVPNASEAGPDGYVTLTGGAAFHIRKENLRESINDEGEVVFLHDLGKGLQFSISNKETPKALRMLARLAYGYADYIEHMQGVSKQQKDVVI